MQRVRYLDVDGRPTDDPAAAVSGEIVDYGPHDRPRRVTRFWLKAEQLPWLPVSEPAFLLWVFAVLMGVWLVIGLVLGLT
jgi:hypothetical protein